MSRRDFLTDFLADKNALEKSPPKPPKPQTVPAESVEQSPPLPPKGSSVETFGGNGGDRSSVFFGNAPEVESATAIGDVRNLEAGWLPALPIPPVLVLGHEGIGGEIVFDFRPGTQRQLGVFDANEWLAVAGAVAVDRVRHPDLANWAFRKRNDPAWELTLLQACGAKIHTPPTPRTVGAVLDTLGARILAIETPERRYVPPGPRDWADAPLAADERQRRATELVGRLQSQGVRLSMLAPDFVELRPWPKGAEHCQTADLITLRRCAAEIGEVLAAHNGGA